MKYLMTFVFVVMILTSFLFSKDSVKEPTNLLIRDGWNSNLIASGYNWERVRIHRPGKFPINPYPAIINKMNPVTAILLYNTDVAMATIDSITFKTVIGDSSAFKFDRTKLIRTLKSGDSAIIPVSFQPTQTGIHVLTFEYNGMYGYKQKVKTTLQGIGIVGKIETHDINFGPTIVDDYNNFITKTITIRNLSLDEWEFGDSVTIANLEEININPEISNNWSAFPEPFRYDKSGKLKFDVPIVLQPGDSLTFNCHFVSKEKGLVYGYLTTVSDAEKDTTSEWIGYDNEYIDVKDELNFVESKIHPNPTSGTINLHYRIETAVIVNIYLTDILGNQTLLKSEYKFPGDYVETFDFSGYPQGIYNVVLQTEKKAFSEKVVIIR
ncbi:MAG: T9SS type A sorting domain-containing protein [bacterium]